MGSPARRFLVVPRTRVGLATYHLAGDRVNYGLALTHLSRPWLGAVVVSTPNESKY